MTEVPGRSSMHQLELRDLACESTGIMQEEKATTEYCQ